MIRKYIEFILFISFIIINISVILPYLISKDDYIFVGLGFFIIFLIPIFIYLFTKYQIKYFKEKLNEKN